MGTVVVLICLLAVIFLAIRSMYKTKKSGHSPLCGGDCGSCHGACHSQNESPQIKKR